MDVNLYGGLSKCCVKERKAVGVDGKVGRDSKAAELGVGQGI